LLGSLPPQRLHARVDYSRSGFEADGELQVQRGLVAVVAEDRRRARRLRAARGVRAREPGDGAGGGGCGRREELELLLMV